MLKVFTKSYASVAEWQTRMFKGHVRNRVWVQVPPLAPNEKNPKQREKL